MTGFGGFPTIGESVPFGEVTEVSISDEERSRKLHATTNDSRISGRILDRYFGDRSRVWAKELGAEWYPTRRGIWSGAESTPIPTGPATAAVATVASINLFANVSLRGER